MVRLALVYIFLLFPTWLLSQALDAHRITAWQRAGLTQPLEAPEQVANIIDFGADPTGQTSCNAAYDQALTSLIGAGTIYFPQGEYLFTSTLAIPDSIFLQGESVDAQLTFDLGGSGHLIQISGGLFPNNYLLAQNGIKGTYSLHLLDASSIQIGDVIRVYMDDEDLMFSSWAYGTLGQIIEVTGKDGNHLTLADPLNHHYPLSRSPFVTRLNPVRNVGIECLTIERTDSAIGQLSNIHLSNVFNAVIRNVESIRCGFAHVEVNSSAHVQIENSYFHHGFGYGGGGRAYGITFQTASSFNLAQNNVFEHLRHSMLLQSGANGNVFGYNYSTEPFWEETALPANSAGDAVLHGNYTFLNLFEGNTVQNMVVDASHGSNGPYNTFFRNRGELYGFFSDGSTTTDSMNIVGNEISLSGFPFGLFLLNGNGHYSHGNNVSGTVTPVGTGQVDSASFYLSTNDLPVFLNGYDIPMIGYPLELAEKTLPAEQRFNVGEPVSCVPPIITSQGFDLRERTQRLHMLNGRLSIPVDLLPGTLLVYSLAGRLIHQERVTETQWLTPKPAATGLIIFRVLSDTGRSEGLKVISSP